LCGLSQACRQADFLTLSLGLKNLNTIHLELHRKDRIEALNLGYDRMINAGYAPAATGTRYSDI